MDGEQNTQGLFYELLVAAELVHRGFGVSWPVGDKEKYDLIVTHEDHTSRVQIKSSATKTKHGTYRVAYCYGSKKEKYTAKDLDFAVTVIQYNHGPAYYIVPVEDAIKCWRATFFQPGLHPTHPNTKKACRLEAFRDRWDLLR